MDSDLNPVRPDQASSGGPQIDGATKDPYLKLVPAVDQSIRLMFALANVVGGEASLTELSKEVGISKSKGLAILNTLRDAGLVTRSERTKNYRLGSNVLALARAFINSTDLAQAVAPYLEELAAQNGCSFHLGIVSGETLFVVARRHAPGGNYMAIDVGHRYPLTWGAHGRAYLATLSEEEFERRLSHSSITQAGETDRDSIERDVLRKQVADARKYGYGMSLGTTWSGLNAVSVALTVPSLDVPGTEMAVAFLVAVGSFSEEKAHEVGQRMIVAGKEMSRQWGSMLSAVNLHFPYSRPLFS